MALGEKHIPKSQRPSLGLEVLKNLGVAFPSFVAGADQRLEDGVSSSGEESTLESMFPARAFPKNAPGVDILRDTVFFDEPSDDVQRLLGSVAYAVADLLGV